jgi:hypothetical protein
VAVLGKDFETAVRGALGLRGLTVEPETLIGHKRVDLLATELRWGRLRRIAVECKCYLGLLKPHEIATIQADYQPLLDKNLIDEILIVTKAGVTPAGAAFIMGSRNTFHSTLDDLVTSAIDFRPYLQGLSSIYQSEGLSRYYVPMATSEGLDLESVTIDWIDGSDSTPIAILGSYGMGKTTFAKHISFVLADRALREPASRQPLYIRLGDIAGEQTLEGLFGKVFTSEHIMPGYSFSGLSTLNRDGRLVFILDGFDEMKHSLSWDDFKYTFSQLHRLQVDNSRILLLGRPTAFMSEEEYEWALKGIRSIHGRQIKEPGWPEYRGYHLAPFTPAQIRTFLFAYTSLRHSSAHPHDLQRVQARVIEQLDAVSGKKLFGIAHRPVQLRMLAEVLPTFNGDLDDLTVCLLYDLFISRVIERESQKLSRRRFFEWHRRAFARELAWWLWAVKGQSSVSAAGIPEDILSMFARKDEDLEIVRRELVTACFLERKEGGMLYFPHRSFQEYLVAEAVVEKLGNGSTSLTVANRACTEEVGAFLDGLVGPEDVKKWDRVLAGYRGQLSGRILKAWLRPEMDAHFLQSIGLQTSGASRVSELAGWHSLLLVSGYASMNFSLSAGRMNAVLKKFADQRCRSTDARFVVLNHLCTLMLVAFFVKDDWDRNPDTVNALESSFLDVCGVGLGMRLQPYKDLEEHRAAVRETLLEAQHASSIPDSMFPCAAGVISKLIMGRTKRVIDLGATYRSIAHALTGYCLVSDWIAGGTLRIPFHSELARSGVQQLVRVRMPREAQAFEVVDACRAFFEEHEHVWGACDSTPRHVGV